MAAEVKRVLQRYHELQDIIAILGMDELSDEEKLWLHVRVGFSSSCLKTSTLRNNSTGQPGSYVPVAGNSSWI